MRTFFSIYSNETFQRIEIKNSESHFANNHLKRDHNEHI